MDDYGAIEHELKLEGLFGNDAMGSSDDYEKVNVERDDEGDGKREDEKGNEDVGGHEDVGFH